MKNNYQKGESDVRPWGKWQVTEVGEGFIVKSIEVNPGQKLSLQRHEHREELWEIKNGEGTVTVGDKTRTLKPGEEIFIPKGAWHRMENRGKDILQFREVQTGQILDENDIQRKEDIYGRVETQKS